MSRRRQIAAAAAVVLAVAGCFALGRYGAYLVHAVAISAIAALGLNLLTGFAGQISFAQGALVGIGAYTAGNLGNAGWGAGAVLAGGVAGGVASVVIGLPALRLRGLYYAIATLAAQFVLEYLFKIVEPLTRGISGMNVSPLVLLGRTVASDQAYAALSLALLAITWAGLQRLMHTNVGRSFLVVRENELVARGMGIDVVRVKLWAFLVSGFVTGVSGALVAFTTRLATPEAFSLQLSVDQVAMLIVGGQGVWAGSLLGATFVVLVPEAIQRAGEAFKAANLLSASREMAFGLLIILFLVFEPRGLAALLRRLGRALSRLVASRASRASPTPAALATSRYPATGGSREKAH
ncbi:MAG: branched-chain amino acid ABC transporter permease [Deltaproteobacteria bacterium]|nr:branched-chain amino acid ABC transporter permease [Deltaproteobacteria bacterium]